MTLPLMPKATAVWLVEHTALTFEQIGDFCGLHKLEIQAIADGEVSTGIMGLDPVAGGQLRLEEIKRCEEDPRARLKIVRSELPQPLVRAKGPRYTPVSKRADKPDAIAYLVKTYPELLDAQVARLLGTTKDTIAKVRDRRHWNAANIKPRSPVLIGLCKQADLEAAIKKAQRRVARERKAAGLPEEEIQAPNALFPSEEGSTFDAPRQSDAPLFSTTSTEQPEIDAESLFKNMNREE